MKQRTFFSQLTTALARTSPAFAPGRQKTRQQEVEYVDRPVEHSHVENLGLITSLKFGAQNLEAVQEREALLVQAVDRLARVSEIAAAAQARSEEASKQQLEQLGETVNRLARVSLDAAAAQARSEGAAEQRLEQLGDAVNRLAAVSTDAAAAQARSLKALESLVEVVARLADATPVRAHTGQVMGDPQRSRLYRHSQQPRHTQNRRNAVRPDN